MRRAQNRKSLLMSQSHRQPDDQLRTGATERRLPCGHCGYELESILSSQCPECGADCTEPERPDLPERPGIPARPPMRPGAVIAIVVGIVLMAIAMVLMRMVR